ncbi:cytochrome c biogenesis CcdA family protein [Amphibacillus cookii]|uniref:cytochrome c biogenesis CcdA family protein n=1 Tax=Amphibacillus cookii TaxID=767787 RepID=UPI00195B0932|nr:cytochrome c biogenesis protein CcdA [Amphibacillus cookii]MBM7540338.1 cytochrome c-type biogenesis protein [Amphibacillus cookii]
MESAADITIWLAFSAGVLSFLSPCTLPIFPGYLSYITGVSVKDLQGKSNLKLKVRLFIHAISFLLGVSMIFFSLGLGATVFGEWLQQLLTGASAVLIQRIAGLSLMIIGLVVGGWFRFSTLMKTKRFQIKTKPVGMFGSFLVGVGFSAGWTPCIGPIFASILILATTSPAQGALYTSVYLIGFALPFLFLTFFLGYVKSIVKYSEQIMKLGGGLIIIFGLLLFTGQLARFSNYILRMIQDTWFSNLG